MLHAANIFGTSQQPTPHDSLIYQPARFEFTNGAIQGYGEHTDYGAEGVSIVLCGHDPEHLRETLPRAGNQTVARVPWEVLVITDAPMREMTALSAPARRVRSNFRFLTRKARLTAHAGA